MFHVTTEEGQVLEGSPAVFMAQVRGQSAALITQASITSISYRVWNLTTGDEVNVDPEGSSSSGSQTTNDPLTVSAVVFDTLQTDAGWTKDQYGYNFRHTMPAAAFPDGNVRYKVEYKFTPTSGEAFFLRPFVVYAIPLSST